MVRKEERRETGSGDCPVLWGNGGWVSGRGWGCGGGEGHGAGGERWLSFFGFLATQTLPKKTSSPHAFDAFHAPRVHQTQPQATWWRRARGRRASRDKALGELGPLAVENVALRGYDAIDRCIKQNMQFGLGGGKGMGERKLDLRCSVCLGLL